MRTHVTICVKQMPDPLHKNPVPELLTPLRACGNNCYLVQVSSFTHWQEHFFQIGMQHTALVIKAHCFSKQEDIYQTATKGAMASSYDNVSLTTNHWSVAGKGIIISGPLPVSTNHCVCEQKTFFTQKQDRWTIRRKHKFNRILPWKS